MAELRWSVLIAMLVIVSASANPATTKKSTVAPASASTARRAVALKQAPFTTPIPFTAPPVNHPAQQLPHYDRGLAIQSNLTALQPSVTHHMQVWCSMTKDPSGDVDAIMSLVMLKWNANTGDHEEIISVDAFHQQVVVYKDVGAAPSGWIIRETGRAYLHLHWENPTQAQAGQYVCEANVLLISSHTDTITVGLDIGLLSTGIPVLTNTVIQLQGQIDNLTRTVSNLAAIVNYNTLNISDLKLQVETNRKNLRETLFGEFPATIGSEAVLLSKSLYYDFASAQAICSLIGGKLPEFDVATDHTMLWPEQIIPGEKWWFGAIRINNTVVYPSTQAAAPFQIANDAPDGLDPACLLLQLDPEFELFHSSCSKTEGRRVLCTFP